MKSAMTKQPANNSGRTLEATEADIVPAVSFGSLQKTRVVGDAVEMT